MDFRDAAKAVDWDGGARIHIPCVDTVDCGSSDAASVYQGDDGLKYFCHACGLSTGQGVLLRLQQGNGALGDKGIEPPPAPPLAQKKAKVHVPGWSDPAWKGATKPVRGIRTETLRKYGIRQAFQDDVDFLAFPYLQDGQPAFAKLRSDDPKEFVAEGSGGEPLFGMHLFAPDKGRSVVVTEGEYDAPAAFQMLANGTAVVSIRNGATGAAKDIKEAFEWLNGFEKVILCFDNDDPGRKATAACAEVLGRKAWTMDPHPTYKDACDYLKANDSKEFVKRWYAAQQYSPDGIVSISKLGARLEQAMQIPVATWHMPELQKVTQGIFDKRLYLFAAGSGSGKSTFSRGLAYHLWKTTDAKIGMMFLEEAAEETLLHLIGQHTRKAAHLPSVTWAEGERHKAWEELCAGDRFEFWDHFDALDADTVLRRMNYMVKVLGCRYIFFDHVSLVASSNAEGDERRNIDNFMTKLRHFVEGTGATVFAISHLTRRSDKPHENGGEIRQADLRGSGALAQLSDVVIAMERNQQAEDAELRDIVNYRILKNRPTGVTGPAGSAKYVLESDILVPWETPQEIL